MSCSTEPPRRWPAVASSMRDRKAAAEERAPASTAPIYHIPRERWITSDLLDMEDLGAVLLRFFYPYHARRDNVRGSTPLFAKRGLAKGNGTKPCKIRLRFDDLNLQRH
jgi:hypothetical protein